MAFLFLYSIKMKALLYRVKIGFLETENEGEISPHHLQQGVHGQGKSQGKTKNFKVRELSGNFEIGQGNLKMKQKVREKSGKFEITSL